MKNSSPQFESIEKLTVQKKFSHSVKTKQGRMVSLVIWWAFYARWASAVSGQGGRQAWRKPWAPLCLASACVRASDGEACIRPDPNSHPVCASRAPTAWGPGTCHVPQWTGRYPGWTGYPGSPRRRGRTWWNTAGDDAALETADPSGLNSGHKQQQTSQVIALFTFVLK